MPLLSRPLASRVEEPKGSIRRCPGSTSTYCVSSVDFWSKRASPPKRGQLAEILFWYFEFRLLIQRRRGWFRHRRRPWNRSRFGWWRRCRLCRTSTGLSKRRHVIDINRRQLNVRLARSLREAPIVTRKSCANIQRYRQQKKPKKGCVFLFWIFLSH